MIEKLQDLQAGAVILLPVNSDLLNVHQLLNIRKISYENLFESYMNNTNEEANKFNLDKFLDKYTEVVVQSNVVAEDIMKTSIDKESFEYMSQHYFYTHEFDYTLRVAKLVIRKLKEDGDNESTKELIVLDC